MNLNIFSERFDLVTHESETRNCSFIHDQTQDALLSFANRFVFHFHVVTK